MLHDVASAAGELAGQIRGARREVAVAANEPFGWVALLPRPAQAKLLVATLKLLNAELLLLARHDPTDSAPTALLSSADVLLRLSGVLLAALDRAG